MRMLTKADVLAEDKLFATVDSTVRKVCFREYPIFTLRYGWVYSKASDPFD